MNTKYRILVVDDEPSALKAMAAYLEKLPLDIITAEDGEAAKALLASEPVNLVITDVNMPKFSGLELLAYVKERLPQAEVIVVTGYATIEMSVEAMRLGAFNFLQKPLDMEALKSQVEKALGIVLDDKLTAGEIRANVRKEGVVHRFVKSEHKKMQELFSLAKVIAPTDSTVLITGESGTGKEMLAQYIHVNGNRTGGALVPVNCGAIPESLMESELFGHVKGAFTGAIAARKGRLKHADGGTLFLDEIGELPLQMQVKLLRVLQTKEYEPVGSSKSETSDFRVVAATNKDLEKEVEEGNFREDLYYRLNVIPLHIPPLRERREDILKLVNFFVGRFNKEKSCHVSGFEKDAEETLLNYDWPGNIRELENIVERMVIIHQEGWVKQDDLPRKIRRFEPTQSGENLLEAMPDDGLDFNNEIDKVERRLIELALNHTNGNRNQAAKMLRLNRTTLVEKIKKKKIDA